MPRKLRQTPISLELCQALGRRIEEPRTDYSGILQYLHSGKIDHDLDPVYKNPTKARISTQIEPLINRLRHSPVAVGVDGVGTSNNSSDIEVLEEPAQKKRPSNLQAELNNVLSSLEDSAYKEQPQVDSNLLQTIKKEMTF